MDSDNPRNADASLDDELIAMFGGAPAGEGQLDDETLPPEVPPLTPSEPVVEVVDVDVAAPEPAEAPAAESPESGADEQLPDEVRHPAGWQAARRAWQARGRRAPRSARVLLPLIALAFVSLLAGAIVGDDGAPREDDARQPTALEQQRVAAAARERQARSALEDAVARRDYDEAIRIAEALGDDAEVQRLRGRAGELLLRRAARNAAAGDVELARARARRAAARYGADPDTVYASVRRIERSRARRARDRREARRSQQREPAPTVVTRTPSESSPSPTASTPARATPAAGSTSSSGGGSSGGGSSGGGSSGGGARSGGEFDYLGD